MYQRFMAVCLAGLIANSASATIIDGQILRQSGSGTFVKLTTDAPFDVGEDNFNTCHLYGFD